MADVETLLKGRQGNRIGCWMRRPSLEIRLGATGCRLSHPTVMALVFAWEVTLRRIRGHQREQDRGAGSNHAARPSLYENARGLHPSGVHWRA
jgi:hypothetical protein